MPGKTSDELSDLIGARARIEYLEQELSQALHLFYSSITWILTVYPPDPEQRIAKIIRAKILHMPQGCPLGQLLIALDEQNGGLLESKGILLSRWVFEPRKGPYA